MPRIIVNTEPGKWDRHYRVTQIELSAGSLVLVRSLSTGSLLLQQSFHNHQRDLILSPDGVFTESPLPASELIDMTKNARLHQDDSRLYIERSGQRKEVPGYLKLPNLIGIGLLNDESVLFIRQCDHPFRDHMRLFISSNGLEVSLDQGLGNPQITATQFMKDGRLYVRYSYGTADKWHYYAARINLEKMQTEVLGTAPIAAVSSGGALAGLEQETIERDNGDLDTHWNHQIELYDNPGATGHNLKLFGYDHFEQVYWLGDLLALQLFHEEGRTQIACTPIEGGPLPNIPLPSSVCQISSTPNGTALLWLPMNPAVTQTRWTLVEAL